MSSLIGTLAFSNDAQPLVPADSLRQPLNSNVERSLFGAASDRSGSALHVLRLLAAADAPLAWYSTVKRSAVKEPAGLDSGHQETVDNMAKAVKDIEREIRGLSSDERAELMRVLIADFDAPADADVEPAWLETSQRRYRELVEGKVKGVPGPLVFDRLRKRLGE